jgi:molybdopterin converting factor small subunit
MLRMKVTFKLYATLSEYLPGNARDHQVETEIAAGTTPNQIIDSHGVPRKLAHLVVLNGVYVHPSERDQAILRDGDTLAVWPPVAGG